MARNTTRDNEQRCDFFEYVKLFSAREPSGSTEGDEEEGGPLSGLRGSGRVVAGRYWNMSE